MPCVYLYIFNLNPRKSDYFCSWCQKTLVRGAILAYVEDYFMAFTGRNQCKDRQPTLYVVPCDHPLALAVPFKVDSLDLMRQWRTVGSLQLLAFSIPLISASRIDDIHRGELSGL